jgi:hypothetical protein
MLSLDFTIETNKMAVLEVTQDLNDQKYYAVIFFPGSGFPMSLACQDRPNHISKSKVVVFSISDKKGKGAQYVATLVSCS